MPTFACGGGYTHTRRALRRPGAAVRAAASTYAPALPTPGRACGKGARTLGASALPARQSPARQDKPVPGLTAAGRARCTLAGGALFKAGGRPPASRAGRPYFGEGMNEDEASDAPPCAGNYRPAAGRGLPGRGRTGRAAGCGRRSSHSRAVQHNAGSSRRTRRRFLVRHHAFACRGRNPSSRNRPAARSLVRGAAGLCRGGV